MLSTRAPWSCCPRRGSWTRSWPGYLQDGIANAAAEGAPAVVIKLDTPGGSLEATRDIVQAVLDAPLPVIVWVAPAGGRAASAGTFITLAGHVAAMAPGTNIGAASPVGGQGEDIEGTLGDKVMNDAIASITAIADERGRPVDWAVGTVRDASLAHRGPGARRGRYRYQGRVAGRPPGAGRWPDGVGPGSAVGTPDGRRADDRIGHEPVPGVPAPAGRPQHRLHPVLAGLDGPHVRAPEPQLRDGHPGRLRHHPRVHRLWQPAARYRQACCSSCWPSCCSCWSSR